MLTTLLKIGSVQSWMDEQRKFDWQCQFTVLSSGTVVVLLGAVFVEVRSRVGCGLFKLFD